MRRLSALSGICGVATLGAVADTANVLIANGWDASLINGLLQAGATDEQLTDLLNGTTDPTQILYQLKLAKTANAGGGTNPTLPPPQPTNPGSVGFQLPAPQIPAGSTLLYQVNYTQSLLTVANLTLPASSVVSQLASQLPQYGMQVLQSSVTDNGPQTFAIAFSIRVIGGGFAQQNDAYSILHSLMQRIVGNTITSDPMSVVAAGPTLTAASGGPGLPAPNMGTWFQSNWGYIALALGALVIGPPLIKKL